MAVYVDKAVYLWRGRYWCHMFADDTEELHKFAKRLGLKRAWFQNDVRLPHYDVTANKRREAVNLGAMDVERSVTYQHIKKNCAKVGEQPAR